MYYLSFHNRVHFKMLGVCYNVFLCLFWNRENKGILGETSRAGGDGIRPQNPES